MTDCARTANAYSRALVLVERRTYKPAGWKDLREVEQIQRQDERHWQSYRYSIIAWIK